VQQPYPQVFGSGNSQESGALAARHHLSMALSFQPIPRARQLVDFYRDEAARAGWSPTADDIVVRGFVHVAKTDSEAQQLADEYDFCVTDGGRGMSANVLDALSSSNLAPVHSADLLHQEGVAFIGSPDTVLTKMQRLREEVGANVLDAMFVAGKMPYERARSSLELFGTKVLPRVHEL
jgi:alkanesulfonate monooxygenase SsuD/methylene tetrahydromethanopterin reductase-like flavin-dependent oxidoreductase (luciferase family)